MYHQIKLSVEIILNIVFSMTTGVPKLESKTLPHPCNQRTSSKCFPHQCSVAYEALRGRLLLILALQWLNPQRTDLRDKYVIKVTSKYSHHNFVWHTLLNLNYERDYIRKLLKGVHFKLEIKELQWIAFKIHSRGCWHMLFPEGRGNEIRCNHNYICSCNNIRVSDSVWSQYYQQTIEH